jgi:hypothetical protein
MHRLESTVENDRRRAASRQHAKAGNLVQNMIAVIERRLIEQALRGLQEQAGFRRPLRRAYPMSRPFSKVLQHSMIPAVLHFSPAWYGLNRRAFPGMEATRRYLLHMLR